MTSEALPAGLTPYTFSILSLFRPVIVHVVVIKPATTIPCALQFVAYCI